MSDKGQIPLLEVRGISKSFPGVKALSSVNLSVHKGEILAVIGENGAGKSTLMNILGGIVSSDSGEIYVEGKRQVIDSVRTSIKLGIALIHQELNLLDNLDIAANIYLAREPYRKFILKLIDFRSMYYETRIILEILGLGCSPKTIVGDLPIGQRQLVEIGKALSLNSRLLIMDEPTSSLSKHETAYLFRIIKNLKAQNVSIIYISHRIGEVKEIADRVIVLRDGCNSGELAQNEIEYDEMVRLMVGRNIQNYYHHTPHETKKVALEVRDLLISGSNEQRINLKVHSGEIVVIAGLVGAGRTELLESLFGISKILSGEIFVNGNRIRITSPTDSIRAGIFLVPEDRRKNGLVVEMNVEENITLPALKENRSLFLIDRKKIQALAKKMVMKLSIRTPSIYQKIELLSGGNQQKVVLAKWLTRKLIVLLLDDPTRGVDVGAKEEIYKIIEQLSSEGVAILMSSSEMQEVMGIADRILVLHNRSIRGELSIEQFSEETIVNLATGREN